jgi:hypothetical protein
MNQSWVSHSFRGLQLAVVPLIVALAAQGQSDTAQPAATPAMKVDLVLTPEFCATKSTKGDAFFSGKETFLIGEASCSKLETALKRVFPGLTRVDAEPAPGASSPPLVLVPRFVDIGATKTLGAFSNRELVILLEWTAKDAAGKAVWIETVQGSAKHHSGNLFTMKKNRKLILRDAAADLAQASAAKMSAAPQLRRLHP